MQGIGCKEIPAIALTSASDPSKNKPYVYQQTHKANYTTSWPQIMLSFIQKVTRFSLNVSSEISSDQSKDDIFFLRPNFEHFWKHLHWLASLQPVSCGCTPKRAIEGTCSPSLSMSNRCITFDFTDAKWQWEIKNADQTKAWVSRG